MREPIINLNLGDCLQAMKGMRDKQYDLAIVDPPYAVGASDGSFGAQEGKGLRRDLKHYANHKEVPEVDYFNELFRISTHQIIWGANYYPKHLFHSGWIIWFKEMTGPLSDAELAFQSIDKVTRCIKHRWSGYVKEPSDAGVIRIHPNQKPVGLYKWLLKKYAKPGDKILDTHGGSMSIAIACYEMGFDLDLWEIDKDYYEAGVKRFNDHKKQLKLFRA